MKHTYITKEIIDNGERVACDVCSEKILAGDKRSGGFLFGSYAYCPKCAVEKLPAIRNYGEEHFIKAWCPEGLPFRDWILWLRNGNNNTVITTRETKEES